ncbi:hypothetical protein BX600DRAFT_518330 [Xylariales sp. PMI_506]|nr:hypothetical protein BX600DRAFT_518330 [Xylariales sp. PMI_506]
MSRSRTHGVKAGLAALHAIGAIAQTTNSAVSAVSISTSSSTTSTALATSTTTGFGPQFEVDIIFPRNETYRISDNLPIVLAIQNLTTALSLGPIVVSWDIMPFTRGVVPGGITFDTGVFPVNISVAGDNEYLVVVDSTNVSSWIAQSTSDEQYMLQWGIAWGEYQNRQSPQPDYYICFPGDGGAFAVMFSIETDLEAESGKGSGIAPDIATQAVGQCPIAGSLMGLPQDGGNSSSCPTVTAQDIPRGSGNPCAVQIDSALASSIAALATSIASTPTTTATASSSQSSKTNAAAAPLGSASSPKVFVAACITMTYLVLSTN